MRKYRVKDIFYTIQGEGARIGRPAVFVRFSGCNLWSGKEEDRNDAVCKFCDTDFRGGSVYQLEDLVEEVSTLWPRQGVNTRYVVLTGGEPLLQVDRDLVDELKKHGFEVAVETNGTIFLPCDFDWVTVSPKAGSDLKVTTGNELKVVYPQPLDFQRLLCTRFTHYYLQPMDGDCSLEKTLNYCLKYPDWKLGMRGHRLIKLIEGNGEIAHV